MNLIQITLDRLNEAIDESRHCLNDVVVSQADVQLITEDQHPKGLRNDVYEVGLDFMVEDDGWVFLSHVDDGRVHLVVRQGESQAHQNQRHNPFVEQQRSHHTVHQEEFLQVGLDDGGVDE